MTQTRYDCNFYHFLHCYNVVRAKMFNVGVFPRCHYYREEDASGCSFFEEKEV